MSRLRRPGPALAIGLVVGAVIAAGAAVLVPGSDAAPPQQAHAAPAVAPTYEAAGGVFDWFSRADSATTMGQASTGQSWQPAEGVWGISGESAYLARGDPAKRNLTVIDVGASDGSVLAVQRVTSSGSGIVFRYVNEFNYWSVRNVPAYGTWTVEKIVGGIATVVGNLGLVHTDNGTTLDIDLNGARIGFAVDGGAARTFVDPTFQTATEVGLIYIGAEPTIARWSLLIASRHQYPDASGPISTTTTTAQP